MRRAGHNCQPSCDERASAENIGEFVYLRSMGGWVFVDAPKRMPAARLMVQYAYGQIDKLPDTRGLPYVWFCCPWCGGDCLPPQEDGEQ